MKVEPRGSLVKELEVVLVHKERKYGDEYEKNPHSWQADQLRAEIARIQYLIKSLATQHP